MLYIFDEINSTQDKLKELYHGKSAVFGDAVLAKKQTSGRGRFGRSFFSPEKTGIYLSILLPYEDTHLMTIGAGVVVSESILATTGIKTGIKWINDIFLNGKKVAGILAEAISDENGTLSAVILGVGINIAWPEGNFPEEIKETAGVLFPDASAELPRGHTTNSIMECLVSDLVERLGGLPGELKKKSLLQQYKARLINPQDVPEGALD